MAEHPFSGQIGTAAGDGAPEEQQFCQLMINYDLSWNPTRLEQRLGRIHRVGQTRDAYAFNFVATSSEDGQPVIEGRILERLLGKLDRMREAPSETGCSMSSAKCSR